MISSACLRISLSLSPSLSRFGFSLPAAGSITTSISSIDLCALGVYRR
ncbi:hypothetical protein KUF71_021209 [Frankliniella fusca]|uniref:Uncharacterized protein n=1 Tax=Frankliniella fusca TaxID=407009 RepID=A0AAE1L990_9NEOP|nr:hypothetical protein KUF71_021209 [Frankliniella fusca]